MSLGYIAIDGRSCQEFGVYTTDAGIYDRPERQMRTELVPGRNGELLIDEGYFKNQQVRYPAFIVDDFENNYNRFLSFLLSQGRYFRLEDSFRPDEYRQAYFKGPLSPIRATKDKGTFEIIANCKPQRFLKSGDEPIIMVDDMTIFNPTYYSSKPLVRVYGTGSVIINGVTITILSAETYTDIDCDSQMAYKGSTNCNSNIQLNNNEFWELPAGSTSVSLGSRIDRVELTPRWYEI